jgi:hypothetical protein
VRKLTVFLLLLLLCPLWAAPIKVLLTGDMHGMVLPRQVDGRTYGGAAEMLAYWKKHEGYRASQFITIANGDIATNGALYSSLLKGMPAIEAMNLMGYDVCSLGNHEFDMGVDGMKAWQRQAKFPFVSANLTVDGQPWIQVPPYVILTQNGVKVGIIGLTTQHLNQRKGLPIAQPFADALRKYVPEMRAQGARVIIVAAHEWSGLLLETAQAVRDLGIPLWLGAHSHEITDKETEFGRIVCAGDWFDTYARIDLDYDPRTGACTVQSVQIKEVVSETRPPADRTLAARLAAWKKRLPDGRKTAPRIAIPRLAAPPAIDGMLAAGEWDATVKLNTFLIPGEDKPADPATRAWLGVAGDTLYLAARCTNVPGAAPKTTATQHDGAVWSDDSIEWFIWPDETQPRFVHFIVSASGVAYDADNRFDLASTSQRTPAWNPVYTVKTGAEDGAWILEMALPLAAAGLELRAGKEFRLNVTRNIQGGSNRVATWSPLPMGNFHIPPYFGVAVLGKK